MLNFYSNIDANAAIKREQAFKGPLTTLIITHCIKILADVAVVDAPYEQALR